MNAPIEDVRLSIGDDSLAQLVRSANDEIDADLAIMLGASASPDDFHTGD